MSLTTTAARINPALRTAVLYQAGPVPAVGGVVKPPKPGGYSDSGADIAYALRTAGGHTITPNTSPSPIVDRDWVFPDTVTGIRAAISAGANTLWANTTLHSSHALVHLRAELSEARVKVVGQNPLQVEKYEDKAWVNGWLAAHERLRDVFPRALLYKSGDGGVKGMLQERGIEVPCVVKPVRGRGSYGVTKVDSVEELEKAVEALLTEGDSVLIEEFCAGEEVTITVLPPGTHSTPDRATQSTHWSLPIVTRFNHTNGIAPYNGVVAVTANSRALTSEEHDADPAYEKAQQDAAYVAQLCGATAPMRIDGRRRQAGGAIILFDVNLKPNATGPGRPGREDQLSLTGMAAQAIGWDYEELCVNIVNQAVPIEQLLAD